MIRNEKEYREALRARDEQRVGLQEAKERLEKKGLDPADVEYALNPSRSFLLEIEDEIGAYERLKDSAARGEAIQLSSLKSLGRALVEARIARGCTQRELAEQLGVHETQVSRDEKNDYKGVTVERASRLLDALRFQFEGCLVPAEAAIKQSLEVSSEDQVQIDTSAFATAFRNVLPQNPNIVFLGETCDYVSANAFVGNVFETAPFETTYWRAGRALRYVTIETSLLPDQGGLLAGKGRYLTGETAWKGWAPKSRASFPIGLRSDLSIRPWLHERDLGEGMKDAAELEVKQARIFPVDGLPILRLLTPAVAKAFKERFGWGGAEASEGEVVFQPGAFPNTEDRDTVLIKSLRMNERRLVLSVSADSARANLVHKGIVDFLAEVAGWKPVEPLILTEETTCIATLGFDWTALVSPAMREFALGRMIQSLSEKSTSPAKIRGLRFAFLLAYPEVPQRLQESGVTLAEKLLTIEPRVNTALSERRYFTSSPTDSDTHLQLLKQLERILGDEGQKRGKKE